MSRFNQAFVAPNHPETLGATIESARALAKLGEECILLQEPLTEGAINKIGKQGTYLCYTDMFTALGQRYIWEDPPKHLLNQDQLDSQATLQWKRYISFLRPDLYALMQELSRCPGVQDPSVTWPHSISGNTFARSLTYRTIISREGLEELQFSKALRRKLGKQTVATLDMLLDISPPQIDQQPPRGDF